MRHFRFLGSGLLALALLAGSAIAQTGTAITLYNFATATGRALESPPIFDALGNLYGPASSGGSNNAGIIYQLTPNLDGTWSETTLHQFGIGSDGVGPSAELVSDGLGNFYSVTLEGGTTGNGAVYRLTPNLDGTWTETIIYNFQGFPSDGSWPNSALIFDSQGNLWGTTLKGGKYDGGTLYELTPNGDGTWAKTFLYQFNQRGPGGWSPRGKLAVDAQGNMYAVTENGGKFNHGTAWKFTISVEGGGSFAPIHQFGSGVDGADPFGGVVSDAQGNIFGTTINGGKTGAGTAWELSPTKAGGWAYKVLANFMQGEHPTWSLLPDGAGGYYGTAPETPATKGRAYVFHLTETNNVWGISKVSGVGSGFMPESGVVWGPDGKLYGANAEGGTKFAGTVYQVSF
jgi:uncharacterized repeat protein (TIGR03803 family)